MKAIFSKDIETVINDLAIVAAPIHLSMDSRKTTVRFFGLPIYVKNELFTRSSSLKEESQTGHQ